MVMEAGSEDLASFFKSQTKDRQPLSDNLIRFYWEVMLKAVQALHREGMNNEFAIPILRAHLD